MTQEVLDFELDDILEEITLDKDGIANNDEKVMEENIKYILRREKLWKKGYMIIFPSGATAYLDVGNTNDDPSSYEYAFEVFSDLNTCVACGTVDGCLMVFREHETDDEEGEETGEVTGLEVVDMNMTITDPMPRFLDQKDKERVEFT